eukprot:gene22117-28220_t
MATARKRVKAVHVPFLHVNHPIFQHESHMAAVAILPQIESAYNTAGGLLHITNCPNSSLSRESFVRVIYEAFKANNNDYREEAAVAWADGFTIPPEAIWSDTAAVSSYFTVIRICVGVINSLLGPTANNVKKEQVGRALDMLGWHIDLDTMAVSIAEHNMQKAIYIFFVKDINGAFTLTDAQRMASLANRYVELCPHMTPYTASLYKFEKGYNAKGGALRHLSLEQKRDVEMWRAFLCLSKFDTKFYARPMRTFLRAKPTYVMNYDASLTGLGVRISRIIPESEQYELMVYTAMSIPFSGIKGDSSHQNMCEYTAVLLGLLLLHQLKVPKHFTYILIGDSMSSLAWMLRQSTNSAIAHNAHIGLTTTALNLDALVAEAFWLESEANFVADGLSRGVAGKDLNLPEDLFFPVVEKSVIDQVIHACNPSQKVQTAEDTVRFTKALIALLHQEEPT